MLNTSLKVFRAYTLFCLCQMTSTNLAAFVGLVAPTVGLAVLTLRSLCVRWTNTTSRVGVADVPRLVANLTLCQTNTKSLKTEPTILFTVQIHSMV